MPCQLGAVFWQLIWLPKLMLICIKPSDGAIMAILQCYLNFSMMQIWNCLEVRYAAPTVFTSYLPLWSLCLWNSALPTVRLHYPTATITFINIHLFCDAFLMVHINWLCCWFTPLFSCYSFFSFLYSLFSGKGLLLKYTLMFSPFIALLLCCCVSFCCYWRRLSVI